MIPHTALRDGGPPGANDKAPHSGRPVIGEEFTRLVGRVTSQTGVHTVVLGTDGTPLYQPAGKDIHCPNCRTTRGADCKKNWEGLFRAAQGTRDPIVQVCRSTRAHMAALPVFAEGELLSVWLLCRFAYDGGGAPRSGDGAGLPAMTADTLRYLQLLITTLSHPIVWLGGTSRELEMLTHTASELAYTDPLLGLPNCNQLQKDLAGDIGGCFLLLDVSDLAKVNDAYGRKAGDALLRGLRDHLLGLEVPDSKLYRLATADFGLWVPDYRRDGLLELAQGLLDGCAKPWALAEGGRPLDIVFSGAVGILPLEDLRDKEIDSVSAAVSQVMEQAARTGGIALFDGGTDCAYYRRLRIEMELRRAVGRGMEGFSVVYQPIIDPGNALWKGVEALCRWRSGEFGDVSPAEFIPIAEAAGLMGELGLWILDEAVGCICALGLCRTDHFVLHVNLSPVQLADGGVGDKILAVLARHGYPPDKLCLEITESAAVEFSGRLLDTLEQLSSLGVQFALDDFGVGYASLSSLYHLPVDIIKTDRSLVQDVEGNAFLQRLFYVMGELAHVNGMKIVAEGVESEAQVGVLLMEGADYFQGYLFSEPLGGDELGRVLGRFHNASVQRPALEYSRDSLWGALVQDSGYVLPPALYGILNRCMNTLFTDPQVDRAITRVLGIVGQALDVGRAYVFLRGRDDGFVLSHDWRAEGVPPFREELRRLGRAEIGPRWLQALMTREMLVTADVGALPADIRRVMERSGTKAFAAFALVLGGVPVGTVNFSDCKGVRYWSREDVRMLQLLANMLASALQKEDLMSQVERQNDKLQTIFDQIKAMVYVVEPDTGEILFANRHTQDVFPGRERFVGETCWKVFQGRDARCGFCPVAKLVAHPEQTQSLEMYSEDMDCYLQICMTIVPWQTHRQGVLCHAYNITELKDRQHELERTASMDSLTQVYNRAGFSRAARRMLEAARRNGLPATLAFLDVDGLKEENDRRGHLSGDALLCAIVEHLRRRIRDTDLIGRYGGDEFLVLFYGCPAENAAACLEAVLEELAALDEPDIGKHHSFSYGLAADGEAACGEQGGCRLDGLVAIADQRMLLCKNARHGGGRDGGRLPRRKNR